MSDSKWQMLELRLKPFTVRLDGVEMVTDGTIVRAMEAIDPVPNYIKTYIHPPFEEANGGTLAGPDDSAKDTDDG